MEKVKKNERTEEFASNERKHKIKNNNNKNLKSRDNSSLKTLVIRTVTELGEKVNEPRENFERNYK